MPSMTSSRSASPTDFNNTVRNGGVNICARAFAASENMTPEVMGLRGAHKCTGHSRAERSEEPGIHSHDRQLVALTEPNRSFRDYGFRARAFGAPRNDLARYDHVIARWRRRAGNSGASVAS